LELEGLEDRVLLSVNPTIYTVTDASDLVTDTGSLVYAIQQANANPNPAGSLIEFSPPFFSTPQTITLTSTLNLSGTAGPITITGPGANLLTVSGNKAVEVFDVNSGVTASLSGLTISNGLSSHNGGGIHNDGALTLLNSAVTNNEGIYGASLAPVSGGGVQNDSSMTITGCTITNNSSVSNGGGVENWGSITITGSTIANNSISGGMGGGVDNQGMATMSGCTIANNTVTNPAAGGGVDNYGSMTITDCKITNNSVGSGGGDGGGINNYASLTITASTVANNTVGASGEGGGISNENILTVSGCTIAANSVGSGGNGGGISNTIGATKSDNLTLANSTVAGNSAGSKGGGIYDLGNVTAVNTTIADNQVAIGGTGGGLDIVYTTIFRTPVTTATLDNSIVALNTHLVASSSAPDDIAGAVSTLSAFNLIGTGGAGGLTNGINGNQVGVASPGLGPLANNGGPTQTIALLPGSPAIDAGSNALAVDPTTNRPLTYDQRGPGFVRSFNGTIDIGAYERQPVSLVTAVSVDWGIAGTDSLQTAADGLRLLPAGRNRDLPWLGINRVQITFNQPQTLTAADVTLLSARGINYGPVTITGSGQTYTITLSRSIKKPDRVTFTIAGAGIATYTRRLDVLPGDFNDNGVVCNADVKGVKRELLRVTPATVFGDVLGDGTVDTKDYKAERKLVGTKLPRVKVPSAVLARSLARERLDMKHHH
jgi:hypothetical protein